MGKNKKLLIKILSGTSDANIQFDDLCNLLVSMDFDTRVKGSHNIFRKNGIIERINLQRSGDKAKPYQVKEIRIIITKYKLGAD